MDFRLTIHQEPPVVNAASDILYDSTISVPFSSILPHRRPFQRPLPAAGRKFRRQPVHRISGGRPDMESRKNYPQIIHSKFTIFSTMCPKLSTAFHRLFTCNSQEFHSFIHRNVKKHLKATIRISFCFVEFLTVIPGFQVFQPQKRGFFPLFSRGFSGSRARAALNSPFLVSIFL